MKGNRWISLLLSLLACGASSQSVNAQKAYQPLQVEDAVSARFFTYYTPIALSPDGQSVAYVLQDPQKQVTPKDPRYQVIGPTGAPTILLGSDIWIASVASGESKNLTQGQGVNWAPVWSPNGAYLAFFSDRGGKANLWLWEKSSGNLRPGSDAIIRLSLLDDVPRWTPDSRQVVAKILPENSTIDDLASLYYSTPKQDRSQIYAPGSTAVVYSASARPQASDTTQRQQSSAETEVQINRMLSDLVLISVSSGETKPVARGFRPTGYWLSPDGSRLAFMTLKGFAGGNPLRRLYDLVVVSLGNAQTLVVASDIQQFLGGAVSWSPNSTMLSYAEWGPQVRGDCFIATLDGKSPRKLATHNHPSFGAPQRAPVWDSAGEYLYFLASNSLWRISVASGEATELSTIDGRRLAEIVSPAGGGRFYSPDRGGSMVIQTHDDATKQEGFYKVDLTTGKSTKVFEGNQYYDRLSDDASANGQAVVYLTQDSHHDEEIWVTNGDFNNPKQLTHINPQLDHYTFGSSRMVEWRSADGETLRGALLLPSNYKEGGRYPLIVHLYGGASLSDRLNQFGLEGRGVSNLQLFATRGYAVLLPDTELRVGTPMQDLAKCVLPGIDKVIELGIADPNRIGVMGHSYGGYSTLALIVQTTRFKAAVMRSGLGNLVNAYGFLDKDGSSVKTTWAEELQGRMGGTPWQFRDRYIENSPVFYLDRVSTPLLITHGTADTTVVPSLADEVFVGLRRLGKEVVYAKYEGENHSELTWGYANQVDISKRMIAWFDRHLKSSDPLTKRSN